jgi:Polyketide cyclase / dehydrase and lipid transport
MPYVLAIVAAALASLFAVASRKPETFRVARSTVIDAQADRIFGLINDFHQWTLWSPFEKLDPAMTKTFSGPDRGPGASYAWTGNKKAGAGSMTISSSTPSSSVGIAMAFLKPFKSQSTVQFLIEPSGLANQVTWTMSGRNQLASKVMSVFMSMDKMIGKDFAEGLANLKREAESTSGK